MTSDLARSMFREPGCTCATLKERLAHELEQTEVPLCALHQQDEIAQRQQAADQAKIDAYVRTRDAAAAGQRLVEAERAATNEQPESLPLNGDPLERDLKAKLGITDHKEIEP